MGPSNSPERTQRQALATGQRPQTVVFYGVDPLVEHDIEVAGAATPAEKLHQALELMDAGLRMKRDLLKNARPSASESEQQASFEQWLLSGD
jgi:Rv0078B-related antitoxin